MDTKLNLYFISQNIYRGYDTYDSMVVAAIDEEAARKVHPSGEWYIHDRSWATSPEQANVQYIGVAAPEIKPGIILSSFNAG